MLVTSTSEITFPSCADFILVLHDQTACSVHLAHRQTVVLSQLDLRFHPELGFTPGPVDVHVQSSFFAREEVETKATVPEDRWTHEQRSYHPARQKLPLVPGPAARARLVDHRALSGSLMKFSGCSKLATEMSSSTACQWMPTPPPRSSQSALCFADAPTKLGNQARGTTTVRPSERTTRRSFAVQVA